MDAANYSQIVKHATFVSSGNLLDHVFVRRSILENFKDIKCEVKGVYYSDHDSVQICISIIRKLRCAKSIIMDVADMDV